MGGDILDLYSDYLLASTGRAAAARLSELAGVAISGRGEIEREAFAAEEEEADAPI
jgi:hypothetical protein